MSRTQPIILRRQREQELVHLEAEARNSWRKYSSKAHHESNCGLLEEGDLLVTVSLFVILQGEEAFVQCCISAAWRKREAIRNRFSTRMEERLAILRSRRCTTVVGEHGSRAAFHFAEGRRCPAHRRRPGDSPPPHRRAHGRAEITSAATRHQSPRAGSDSILFQLRISGLLIA
jgi:hypothetical protein